MTREDHSYNFKKSMMQRYKDTGLDNLIYYKPLIEEDIKKQEGVYIYRFLYNGGGASHIWFGSERLITSTVSTTMYNKSSGWLSLEQWGNTKSESFFWRAMQRKIPTVMTLANRGIILPSFLCRLCERSVETAYNVLVQYPVADMVWTHVYAWLKFGGCWDRFGGK